MYFLATVRCHCSRWAISSLRWQFRQFAGDAANDTVLFGKIRFVLDLFEALDADVDLGLERVDLRFLNLFNALVDPFLKVLVRAENLERRIDGREIEAPEHRREERTTIEQISRPRYAQASLSVRRKYRMMASLPTKRNGRRRSTIEAGTRARRDAGRIGRRSLHVCRREFGNVLS